MRFSFIAILAILMANTNLRAADSHVFWYNCITNGYNLQANPGPALPTDVIKHEGMIMTSTCRQREGNVDAGFEIGNYDCGMGGPGFCASFWSKDLMTMSGTASYAAVRGEFRDEWGGGCTYCTGGSIKLKIGVVDYYPNIEGVWGSIDDIPATATWMDPSNLLNWFMVFNTDTTRLMCEETLTYVAPDGCQSSYENPLDKHFMEIPVTKQVNWILAHTGENKGKYSGQYAIVFLVNQKVNSAGGKITLYADESGNAGQSTNDPWTTDANSMHLVMTIGTPSQPIKLLDMASPTFNRKPLFTWYKDSLVSTYRIQISSTADWVSPLINLPLTDTFYQPSLDLPYGQIYWKVGDFENSGRSSRIDTFTIRDSLQPNISLSLTKLTANLKFRDSVEQKLVISNPGKSKLTYSIKDKTAPNILAWTYLADFAQSYPHTISAIRQYATNASIDTTSTISASTLDGQLATKDVFLITRPISNLSSTIGSNFYPVLRNFITRGGTVIICAPNSYSYSFLYSAGLGTISPYGSTSSNTTLSLAIPASDLFQGVQTPLLSKTYTYYWLQTDSALIPATYSTYSVISDNKMGSGSIVMLGMDFYSSDTNWSHIIANAAMRSSTPFPTWLSCSSDSGEVAAGSSKEITVRFRSEGLTSLFYSGTLRIRHNSIYVANPLIVPCTLTLAPPKIALSPSGFNLSLNTGDSAVRTLAISNPGDMPLNFTVAGGYNIGSIVINEVNTDIDHIELWNRDVETDISKWRLTWVDDVGTSNSFTIPVGTRIKAGKCLACIELSGTANDSMLYMGTSLGWGSATSLSVTLSDSNGKNIDFMRTGTNLTPVPSGLSWTGTLNQTYGWYRNRNKDTDSASDWSYATSYGYSLAQLNPGQTSSQGNFSSWLSVAYDSTRILPGSSMPLSIIYNPKNLIYSGLYIDSLLILHNVPTQSSPIVVRCSLFLKSTAPAIIPVIPDPTSIKRPALCWHPVDSASTYTIQINTSSDFTTTFITQPVSDTCYIPQVNLPLGSIYWRVKSDRSAIYSQVDNFTVQSDSIPTLIPMTPETLITRRPTLSWHRSVGAAVYKIQIDTSGAFISPLVTLPVADTFFVVGFNLPLGKIVWRVSNMTYNENKYSALDTFFIRSGTETEDAANLPIPDFFGLNQNYPNPFNPTTTIRFAVPAVKQGNGALNKTAGRYVTIKIFDLNGRPVRNLLCKTMTAGFHQIEFNGQSDAGRLLTSGIYICKMSAEGFNKTIKLFLMK